MPRHITVQGVFSSWIMRLRQERLALHWVSLLTDLIRRQFYDFIRQNESDITSDTLVAEWDKFRQVLNENRANGVFLEILYYYQRNVHLAELQDQGEMVSEIFPVTETPRGSYDFVELRRKGGLNLNRVVQVKARPL